MAQAPAPTATSIRALRIKAVADEAFREKKNWEREIREHLEWSDKKSQEILRVAMTLVDIGPWETHGSKDMGLLLSELTTGVEKGEADIVLGFTGHKPPVMRYVGDGEIVRIPLPFFQGMALPLGDRAVIRYHRSDKQMRYTVLHEVAHLFGGLHVPEKSVLRGDSNRMDFVLDPFNQDILDLTRNRDFNWSIRDFSRDELSDLVDLYNDRPRVENDPETEIRIGYLYLAYGDADSAVEEFTRAMELAPESILEVLRDLIIPELEAFAEENELTVQSRYMLGQAYFVTGDREKASRQLRLNCDIPEPHAPSCSLLGGAYLKSADLPKAEQALLRAIEFDDSMPDAYNTLGSAYALAGMHEKAVENFARALELDPDRTDIYFNQGLSYLRADLPGAAEASFRRALEANEDYHRARVKLGLALARQGKLKEARKQIKEFEKWERLSAFMLRDMAEIYFHDGDTKRASKYVPLAKKGGINVKSVEDMIRQGARKPPKVKTEDLIEQVGAYFRTERYDTARELLLKAAEKEPDDPEIYYWFGRIATKEENEDEAARQFRKSLELNREYAPAYLELARLAERREEYGRAVEWFNQYMEYEESPGSYSQYLLGKCHFLLGNFDDAEKNLRGAIQRRSSYGSAFYYLGRVYVAQGRKAEAVQEFKLAVEQRSLSTGRRRNAHYRLAQLLHEAGETFQARRHAQIAERLGHREATQLLDELEGAEPLPQPN